MTTNLDALVEPIMDAVRALHNEAFVAGVCYGRDDWPTDDEEWADLRRGIEAEATGEHFEGWSPETDAALRTTLTTLSDKNAKLVEALQNARLQLEYMDERSPSGTTPAVIAQIDQVLGDQPHD